MITFWGSTAASAVDVTFRLWHDVDFIDADASVGDDYFTTNSTYLAKGAYAEVRTFPSNVLVDSGTTDAAGKVTFTLASGSQYRVRLYAYHDVGGAGRILFVQDASETLLYGKSAVYTAPVNNPLPPVDIVYDAAAPGNEWVNVAAAGSWLIERRPAAFPTFGFNTAMYRVVLDQTPDGGDAGWWPSEMAVYVDPTSEYVRRKYVIVHELAHGLQHWATVPEGAGAIATQFASSQSYLAADGGAQPCPEGSGHQFTSKEYQSAAILEGMADYVAAVAFNNVAQADCRWAPNYLIEWDLAVGNLEAFSCEGWDDVLFEGDPGGVEFDVFGVRGYDWLGLECLGVGAVDNRGNETDWMRFFWDLDTKEGVPFSGIVDNFVEAYPPDWNADDSGDPVDDPRVRLELAFATADPANPADVDYADAWDNQAAYDGVHR